MQAEIRERKQAEEDLRQAQADLSRANRVSSMGELTASLAHEVNQPIAAAITDAHTCLRWLSRDQPDLEETRAAASGRTIMVPAHSLFAPVRACVMAAARVIPDVCGVFVSRSPAFKILTPFSFQFMSVTCPYLDQADCRARGKVCSARRPTLPKMDTFE